MGKLKVNLRDFISGIVFAIAGIYILVGKNVVLGKAFGIDRMPVVSRADFYIHVLGGALLVLSLVLVIRSCIRPGDGQQVQTKEIPLVAIYSAISLILFCFLVKPLKFYPSAVLLITSWVFMFRIKEYHIERKDKKAMLKAMLISVSYSAVVVLVLQLIFTRLLGVRLP